jgi:hypothetical protein
MYKYVCATKKSQLTTRKKTPSGNVPMIGTGGSCCYDIRAYNDFFLSFPNASKIKWRERENVQLLSTIKGSEKKTHRV